MYTVLFAFIWFVALGFSAYATHRLFKYGPFNANLAWSFVRQVTDKVTCVALGVTFIFIFKRYGEGYVDLVMYFCLGYFLAHIVLKFFLGLISWPYVRREQEKK